jgi:hypothetical protein
MAADSSQNQFQLKFAQLSEMLACPACHGGLRLDSERVVCERCGQSYPIVDGIPVLIAEQGQIG